MTFYFIGCKIWDAAVPSNVLQRRQIHLIDTSPPRQQEQDFVHVPVRLHGWLCAMKGLTAF